MSTRTQRHGQQAAADSLDDVSAVAARLGVAAELDRVTAFTADLFPGPMEVSASRDPELLDDVHFVLKVVAQGTAEEVVERELGWMSKSRGVAGSAAGLFRILVDIV